MVPDWLGEALFGAGIGGMLVFIVYAFMEGAMCGREAKRIERDQMPLLRSRRRVGDR
jgi:hypothetical protein